MVLEDRRIELARKRKRKNEGREKRLENFSPWNRMKVEER
jgi:hypothetical protein